MENQAARRTLLAQHEQIRGHLAACSSLAARVRSGEPARAELDAELARLRGVFNDHNALETELVRPLLKGRPHWGAALVDRMLEEHVAEHAAFWELLVGSVDEVAGMMDDLVDELDAHMAAEERTFLSPQVLGDAPAPR
jgi:hypothetical protein